MTSKIDPPWPQDTRHLRIGDLVIDLRYRRVRADGGEVDLPQRVFDLFLLLLAEPHALHSRTDLFQRLWPGLVVEDANLTQSMWLLRRALGESRKSWIRTVAKSGYVFEPPEPLQSFVDPPDAPAPAGGGAGAGPEPALADGIGMGAADAEDAGDATTTETSTAAISTSPIPAPPRTRPGRRRLAWVALGALVLAVGGLLTARLLRDERTDRGAAAAVPAPQVLTVVILEVKDDGAARWPRKLLREWLAWKLDSLPEVQLISEADFAAGHHGANAPLAIFVSSGMVDDAPGEMRVRVRFRQGAQDTILEARGSDAQMSARIDALSRQVVAQLLPARAEPWPTLSVDATAARRYADAVDAIEKRDAIASARILGEVIERSPRFGLARLQLARAQKRLGRAATAMGEIEVAQSLLRPAPPETLSLFAAQRLAIDPKRASDAANAYAALAAGAARKPAIILERAQMLLDAGQPRHALDAMSAPEWERSSLGNRIARLIVLAQAHSQLADPERMREAAQTAERLAREAGKGWEPERGMALLQIAAANARQYGERADTAGYLEAAALFETAGNTTAMLYARFLAESAQPSKPGHERRLDALLAQARAGGYLKLEIEILMRVAAKRHASGDVEGYRAHLEQARSSANMAGDLDVRNRLETILLYDAYRTLRMEDADLRMQRLRAARVEGEAGLAVSRIDAGLSALRGDFRKALDTLSVDTRAGTADERNSEGQLTLHCDRVSMRVQLGDLAGAHADADLCDTAGQPSSRLTSTLQRAQLALLADDRAQALDLLRRAAAANETSPDSPDRWSNLLSLGALSARAGDLAASDRHYADAESKVAGSGFTLLEALLLVGRAENAGARGDWPAARRFAAQARSRVPASIWTIHGRLALLDAADALAGGDRTRATAIATEYRDLAQGRNDALSQYEFQNMLDLVCGAECTHRGIGTTSASRYGIRGSQIAWLGLAESPPVATPSNATAKGHVAPRP